MILFQQNRKARAKGKNVTLKLGIRRRFILQHDKKAKAPEDEESIVTPKLEKGAICFCFSSRF
jgi:hypothetical protein